MDNTSLGALRSELGNGFAGGLSEELLDDDEDDDDPEELVEDFRSLCNPAASNDSTACALINLGLTCSWSIVLASDSESDRTIAGVHI